MGTQPQEEILHRCRGDDMQHIGAENRLEATAVPVSRIHVDRNRRRQAGPADARSQYGQIRRGVRSLPAQARKAPGHMLGVLAGAGADFEQGAGVA